MTKAMIFIDGTWLYANTPRLSETANRTDFHLDFGKLPRVLGQELARQLGVEHVDIVRTFLFGSYASNYDRRDEEAVQRRLDFFNLLREEHHYELEVFPIDFRGRRLRRADRDPRDTFEPREKCVDISLAASLMYYAAVPHAYDIALVVIGDQDFKPLLQSARRLGKRICVVSIRGSCTHEFADPADPDRVRDFDMIWLDDLAEKLELKYEPHQRHCESPNHKGDRAVMTTFHPRKGQKFYCDVCRAEFVSMKQEAQEQYVSQEEGNVLPPPPTYGEPLRPMGPMLTGEVKKKVADRGFGFIHAEDGYDYFFHLTDLEPGLDFNEVVEGYRVKFEVKRGPSAFKAGGAFKAGAAQRVCRVNGNAGLGHDPVLASSYQEG